MNKNTIRLRFAPAPTGMMHLGNVRTALMNYLFARQKNGTFIVRIEDTDFQRNFDPEATNIIQDLTWLDIHFDEGPHKGGQFGPYFQSKRTHLYEEKRAELEKNKLIYRCFCTQEELEKKRNRQQMLKQPPRYDRTCANLTDGEIVSLLEKHTPFIWRFKFDQDKTITIFDLARGEVTFDLKNFSDFPITRQDGTFTFMFANFVDDLLMAITHVFRGEDHLSNTAGQAALYLAFDASLPIFWHMPILCNIDGKKLSKRDFGFSLRDLKDAGFVPEAIVNYLATIGGSFKEEIMSLEELTQVFDFEHIHAAGQIKYDVEKLKWMNHKWIAQYTPEQLTEACKPFLYNAHPQAQDLDETTLSNILQIIKTDLVTLADCVPVLRFYFEPPKLTPELFARITQHNIPMLVEIIQSNSAHIQDHDLFVTNIKQAAKIKNIPLKEVFWFLRLALMGKPNGPSIHDLLTMLAHEESKKRLQKALELF